VVAGHHHFVTSPLLSFLFFVGMFLLLPQHFLGFKLLYRCGYYINIAGRKPVSRRCKQGAAHPLGRPNNSAESFFFLAIFLPPSDGGRSSSSRALLPPPLAKPHAAATHGRWRKRHLAAPPSSNHHHRRSSTTPGLPLTPPSFPTPARSPDRHPKP
jgi:hypothetical protein